MERIGRIKERHSRIANRYNIIVIDNEINGLKKLSVVLEKNENPIKPEKLDGCY
jgi:hypothetical protein